MLETKLNFKYLIIIDDTSIKTFLLNIITLYKDNVNNIYHDDYFTIINNIKLYLMIMDEFDSLFNPITSNLNFSKFEYKLKLLDEPMKQTKSEIINKEQDIIS